MPINETNLIRLAAAAVLFGASGTILAFPCYQVDVTDDQSRDNYSDSCANSPANDRNVSASHLDTLFGETLELVERLNTTGGEIVGEEVKITTNLATGPDDKGNYDFYLATWAFQDIDFRDGYSDISMIINDDDKCSREGGCNSAPDDDYKAYWSAFQATPVVDLSGTWSMPDHGLSHISF